MYTCHKPSSHAHTHSRMYTTNLQVDPEPLFCLCIKTELCDKETLKMWLKNHIYDRKREYITNYFIEVCTCMFRPIQTLGKVKQAHLHVACIIFSQGVATYWKAATQQGNMICQLMIFMLIFWSHLKAGVQLCGYGMISQEVHQSR